MISNPNPGFVLELLCWIKHGMNRIRNRIRIDVKYMRMYFTSRGLRGGFGWVVGARFVIELLLCTIRCGWIWLVDVEGLLLLLVLVLDGDVLDGWDWDLVWIWLEVSCGAAFGLALLDCEETVDKV